MSIPKILREQARARPQQAAIIARAWRGEQRITFAELELCAEHFAAKLEARGLRKGDDVLVLVPMSIPLYIALLGLFRLGAVAMFIDPSASSETIRACCEQAQPRGFIGGWKAQMWRWLNPHLRAIRQSFFPPAQRIRSTAGKLDAPMPSGGDPALITFTSGSTGVPKSAVRTHDFLIAQHRALTGAIRLEPGEIDLTTLPIFVLANLASGITSLVPDADLARPGGARASRIAAQIRRHRPTRTGGSPAFYEALVGDCEQRENFLGGFAKIYLGGAPVFPRLLARLHVLAPAAHLAAIYGSTEAEPIAVLDWQTVSEADLHAMRSGAGLLAGRPVLEARVRVVADSWGAPLVFKNIAAWEIARCAAGVPGEIVVSGEHVLRGYLRAESDAETKFQADGHVWHRTGDAGYFDAAGRLWLLGRCSARIKDSHGVVHPFSAETIADFFAFIRRSALVAVGGCRCLVIEKSCEPTADEWDELRRALGALNIERIVPVPQLPMDRRHHAKIDYVRLRRLVEGRAPARP